jgi:hypothetical protein
MTLFEAPIYSLTKELEHMHLELAYYRSEVELTTRWVAYDTAQNREPDKGHVKRLEKAREAVTRFEGSIKQYTEAIDLLKKAQDSQ